MFGGEVLVAVEIGGATVTFATVSGGADSLLLTGKQPRRRQRDTKKLASSALLVAGVAQGFDPQPEPPGTNRPIIAVHPKLERPGTQISVQGRGA
jgi:hypothetical protein